MFPPLYAILDPAFTSQPLISLAESLADAGVELMQLRDKRGSAREIQHQSRELLAALSGRSVRFIVNDRADIAAIVGAGGVHVGQDDLPVEEARKICPSGQWVGISTHNREQLRMADGTSADYIAVGPIFATSTKENPDPVVGVDLVRAARKLTRKPVVAIGGITVSNAEEILRAGADSLAVVTDLIAASDPPQRAREYLRIAQRVRNTAR